jgi:hypothetical protein
MSRTDQFRTTAEAFSGHRFNDTFEYLAPDVTWTARGESTTVGRDDVIAACQAAAEELGQMTTEFLTFRSIADGDAVAVETVGRYTEAGADSFVASCDLYTFVDEQLSSIVSYAVEIDDPRT